MNNKITEFLKGIGLQNEDIVSLASEQEDIEITPIVDKLRKGIWDVMLADTQHGGKVKATERATLTQKLSNLIRKNADMPDDPKYTDMKLDDLVPAAFEFKSEKIKSIMQVSSDTEANIELRKEREKTAELETRIRSFAEVEIPKLRDQYARENEDRENQRIMGDLLLEMPLVVDRRYAKEKLSGQVYSDIRANFDIRRDGDELIPVDRTTNDRAIDGLEFMPMKTLIVNHLRKYKLLDESGGDSRPDSNNNHYPAKSTTNNRSIDVPSRQANAPYLAQAQARADSMQAKTKAKDLLK